MILSNKNQLDIDSILRKPLEFKVLRIAYIAVSHVMINIKNVVFMSSNPGVKTIEEELVNALYKAEAITEDGKACLGKVSKLFQMLLHMNSIRK